MKKIDVRQKFGVPFLLTNMRKADSVVVGLQTQNKSGLHLNDCYIMHNSKYYIIVYLAHIASYVSTK